MTLAIGSYSKVWSMGHRAAADVLDGDIVIQEKYDGSLFAFRLLEDGEVEFRSKGAQIIQGSEDKLFKKSVEAVLKAKEWLPVGHIFRGEAISKPRHNVLTYERAPVGNIVLFDIDTGGQNYLPPSKVAGWANALGLEPAQTFYEGKGAVDILDVALMEKPSSLGGKTEGFVVKNYSRFDQDGKVLMAKWVRPEFKETAKVVWKSNNPTIDDLTGAIVEAVGGQTRWDKTIRHLEEQSRVAGSMADLGALLPEFVRDIEEECTDYIKQELFDYFWPRIKRMAVKGKPELYRQKLEGGIQDAKV